MVAFEEARGKLAEHGITLVAGSTDSKENAEQTVSNLGLGFAVGHSLPMLETSSRLGTYHETRRAILQPAGFVVRPSRVIATLHYSSGPIGRFVPSDVLSAVEFWKRSSRPERDETCGQTPD